MFSVIIIVIVQEFIASFQDQLHYMVFLRTKQITFYKIQRNV